MSSATDVQHFVDSASKDSVRPAASNTGMSAQNSGSWMLDLVSQHLKFKPAQAGKETQQHQLQGEKSAHTPGGVPSAVPTSQATVQPMQGAMALPAQGPPKKKRGRPVGSRNKGPSKKRQTMQDNAGTQLPEAQQPAAQLSGAVAAAPAAPAALPQDTAEQPIADSQAGLPTELAQGAAAAGVEVQPVTDQAAPASGEPGFSEVSEATEPVASPEVAKESVPAQGKAGDETLGTKRRPRPPKPKLDL